MFEISIQSYFSSAHNLRDYKGQCEAVHGHNWKVEVFVKSNELNDIGLAIDFKDLKNILNSGLLLETERYENFYKYYRYYFNHINTSDLCHEKYSNGRTVLL